MIRFSVKYIVTSYFGLNMPSDGSIVSSGSESSFDVRVIGEYDGTTDVVEWWTRTELLCKHRGVSLNAVLPLRLTGGAFAVWAQLPAESRGSEDAVKTALFAAFALDGYAAYEAFASRRLRPGEAADVYLADLRRLATLFGDLPERALVCAFVAGLPDTVRQVIRAGSRAESLDLAAVVARTRAVLSDDRLAAAAAAAPPRGDAAMQVGTRSRPAGAPRRQRDRRCWTCGRLGHFAAACPEGNGSGSGASAPAPSPES